MNNFIEYFYNIKLDKIVKYDGFYSFVHCGNLYKLYILNSDEYNIKFLINIKDKLANNTLISEIIYNKNNEIVTFYNGISYLLIKIFVNVNKDITLEEISSLSNSLCIQNINVNWGKLWSEKIDYLESLIYENGRKFPLLVDSFNYFIGLAENAISYFNNILINEELKYFVSHKRIKIGDTVEELYNPLNIVFDYRVRDVAEYIKISFFNNNDNIFHEINTYLKRNNLSLIEVKLLISRLLYPSFYFDFYEDILICNKDEKIILNLISSLNLYEKYLDDVINFFRFFYNVDDILWLKK